ncbi:MAG: L-seryl-tRNA(Sec) selenium transferase [Bacillota bacterium]|nr:L-seryl-tRNA(Sec) selenium transferase [Bacillota bacterium]
MNNNLLRKIPKMDSLLNDLPDHYKFRFDNIHLKKTIEKILNQFRIQIQSGQIETFENSDIMSQIRIELDKMIDSTFKRVINGTGIVLHTNLGRAVISEAIIEEIAPLMTHYNTLEYDVETGRRGIRYQHIEEKLCAITGAEAALIVNNNAAAVMLILNTLAQNKDVIVSRGELVEIGGSFRVPDVMKASNSKLVEVGTTNKTHLKDYASSIHENTGMLMKVHTSNYKILGFTSSVEASELVELAHQKDIPLYEDLGSGLIVDLSPYGIADEPLVQDSIKNGIDILSFSGDKLFGGAQAGFIIGKKRYIDQIKKNQLLRAFRIDKFSLAVIDRTLNDYFSPSYAAMHIPTLRMLVLSKQDIEDKVSKFITTYKKRLSLSNISVTGVETFAEVGGGALPLEKLSSYGIRIVHEYSHNTIQSNLRKFTVPIISVIINDQLILDFRTISESEFDDLVSGIEFAVSGGSNA